MKRTIILPAAVLALVLAACGSEQATGSPTPAPTPIETPTAEPTASPTPTETAAATDDGSGSGPTGSLSETLPEEIGGFARQEIPGMEEMIAPMLEQQGLDTDEADFAWAVYGDGELIVTGFRGSGLDKDQLAQLATLMSSGQVGGETNVETETVTVAGKEVLRMTGTDVPGVAYMYVSGDAFFTIIGESQDLAEELLSQLP